MQSARDPIRFCGTLEVIDILLTADFGDFEAIEAEALNGDDVRGGYRCYRKASRTISIFEDNNDADVEGLGECRY